MESVKRCKETWEQCVEWVSFYNHHQARYMERSERENDKSRSPSPPTMREYATISDATPQFQATRQQQSPQSSPNHASQQDEHHSQQGNKEEPVNDRGEEGAMDRGERRERHRGRRNEKEREHNRETNGEICDKKPRRKEREDNGASSAHRLSRSPPIDAATREGSEEREGEGDTLRRRSRSSATKIQSLPRRLPTGDPILHHMLQFQSLEYHSSRGTLLSDSDSAAETTSPIVSTCDEISECPEPMGGQHRKYSREQPSAPDAVHVRSFSLPQQSSHEEWRHKVQATTNGQAMEHSREDRRGKSDVMGGEIRDDRGDHQTEAPQDQSVSEEREGEQSIHDSLEELADLLGDEEMTTETDKGLPPRQGQEGTVSKPKSPNQKHRAESGVAADKTPPELDRKEREKRRRQKQLQKQILLQRQQLKEQKLQEFLEKRKQKGKKDTAVTTLEESGRNSDKRSPKEDTSARERGQNSFKRHQQQHSPSSPNRYHPDSEARDAARERKREERDMVRSWAKAHKKAQTESASRAAQQSSQPQNYPSTATEEPIYNRLAPLQSKEDDVENTEVGNRQSTENLPSSPPPPPYEPPSPERKLAMGPVSNKGNGRSGIQTDMGSPAQQRQNSSHTASTPPTPRFGDKLRDGSQSTLSNTSPRMAGAVVSRPRHTQSFSAGSQLSSASGSAAGSPRTPTRARSLKTSQHSPPKQKSPSLIPRRVGKENGAVSGSVEPYPLEQRQLQPVHDEMQIPIDPSALQKEDLSIAPHNFLTRSSSPHQDKLDKGGKVASVLPTTKKPSTQTGTQYNLETALQEVMKIDNLPPPPTHLLEISEQLEDIDYDELNAPPTAVSKTVLPSRENFEQQQLQHQNQPSVAQPEKRDVNPEMLAKSLDAPRNPTSHPTSYPPHIAKFMSRVRNSSIDADDPTQATNPPNKTTFPNTTTTAMDGAAMNETGLSRQQRSALPKQTQECLAISTMMSPGKHSVVRLALRMQTSNPASPSRCPEQDQGALHYKQEGDTHPQQVTVYPVATTRLQQRNSFLVALGLERLPLHQCTLTHIVMLTPRVCGAEKYSCSHRPLTLFRTPLKTVCSGHNPAHPQYQ
ncbi:hypothetical protein GBAR_LOCUS13567 [Geodia barretti]|nr:hypothetical protein GBAR_LOCUS13567 [Geodia barretti]